MYRLKFSKKAKMIYTSDDMRIEAYTQAVNHRTRENTRDTTDLIFPIVEGKLHDKPFQPENFPTGVFHITGTHKSQINDICTCIIDTDATQKLEIWNTENGEYKEPSGEIVDVEGYCIRYSIPKIGYGCIRIYTCDKAKCLCEKIEKKLRQGEKILLEVVDE